MRFSVARGIVAEGRTLATAESLTGGLLGAAITDVPGSSAVYAGGVIAYATQVKQDVLGVDSALLGERGAVDPDVAIAMAVGVRRLLGADIGVSTTGVAGPETQDGKPVGLVFVGVATNEEARAVRLDLTGTRAAIREAAVEAALNLVLEEVTQRRGR